MPSPCRRACRAELPRPVTLHALVSCRSSRSGQEKRSHRVRRPESRWTASLALHWSIPRWPCGRRGRRLPRPQHLLLRCGRGGRLEDDRRRHLLALRLRRLLHHGLGRSTRRGAVRLERDLRRDGRDHHPHRCFPWRWGVQEHRRGPHVGQRRARRYAPYRQGSGPPRGPGHRLGCRARPRLWPKHGAWRLQEHRRWCHLDQGAVRQRQSRRGRPQR